MIRVVIPPHLKTLARVQDEVQLQVDGTVSLETVLDALEDQHPVLKGTIRDHVTKKRRAMVRFFVCGQDLSHDPTDAPLPEAIVKGEEPVLVIAAIAGG